MEHLFLTVGFISWIAIVSCAAAVVFVMLVIGKSIDEETSSWQFKVLFALMVISIALAVGSLTIRDNSSLLTSRGRPCRLAIIQRIPLQEIDDGIYGEYDANSTLVVKPQEGYELPRGSQSVFTVAAGEPAQAVVFMKVPSGEPKWWWLKDQEFPKTIRIELPAGSTRQTPVEDRTKVEAEIGEKPNVEVETQ